MRDLFKKDEAKKRARSASTPERGSIKKARTMEKDSDDADDGLSWNKDQIVFHGHPVSSTTTTAATATEKSANQQLAKSASRIALYLMREEFRGGGGGGGSGVRSELNIQHTHDFFVIASCKVAASILEDPAKGQEEEELVTVGRGKGSFKVAESMLPAGSTAAAKTILARHGVFPGGNSNRNAATERLRRTCVQTKDLPTLDEWLLQSAAQRGRNDEEQDRDSFRRIYNAVAEAREKGVSGQTLLEVEIGSGDGGASRDDVVRDLLDSRLIIRTGIVCARFVAAAFASPWLLHSFRMTRIKDREKAESVKEDAAVAEAAGKIDWSKVEEVDLLLRPWLRIDGSLNRRVLDRLLGAVLGQAMQRPGATAADICSR